MSTVWKKGRGKLGFLQPLLGSWEASADSPLGLVHCVRTFERVLGGNYIQLTARWEYPTVEGAETRKPYEELSIIGAAEDGQVTFWSFTSDGKRSVGKLADVSDLRQDAFGFEAEMPAGLARMAYWPAEAEDEGFIWVVEARNAKGWNRFLTHQYTRI
ncbi:MAG: hypothetical protein ACKVVP_18900 [Chloroflexota bacterium]